VLVGAGVFVLAGVLALSLSGGMVDALAYLLPALLLLLAVAARRYPGERALLALLERRQRRRRDSDSVVCVSRPRALLPRGGRLIASSLAVRPPPASRAALS